MRYRALGNTGLTVSEIGLGAEDRIACGSCEKRCPFGVPVIARMEKVQALHLL